MRSVRGFPIAAGPGIRGGVEDGGTFFNVERVTESARATDAAAARLSTKGCIFERLAGLPLTEAGSEQGIS